jgi:hypothetical protein
LGTIVVALILSACSTNSPDARAQACEAYVEGRDARDMDAWVPAINRMLELAANVDVPEGSGKLVLDPSIYADILTFGPPPLADLQLDILP